MTSAWTIFMASIFEHAQPIFREPEGPLKHPYLEPGGPYSRSLWDWDSFWMAVALFELAKKTETGLERDKQVARVFRHASGVLENFFEHQGKDGSLPILMTPDDTDYFDCLSDPKNNMAKPVFGQFIALVASYGAPRPDVERWLAGLARFYECYQARYRHKSGLYLWANDIAIGVDDDPTTWGRPPFSSASIFLNSLMLADLRAAAATARTTGQEKLADTWTRGADALQQVVQKLCWDERDGFFYTADVLSEQRAVAHRHFEEKLQGNLTAFWEVLPLKVMTWCGFLPLWNKTATKAQAHRLVTEHLFNDKRFWSLAGIRTLSADERMYSPTVERGNPSNWLGPVWILPNYMIWQGLLNYGYQKEADQVVERITRLLLDDFTTNHHLHEYYEPETGKGVCGPGFWSWNILAGIMK